MNKNWAGLSSIWNFFKKFENENLTSILFSTFSFYNDDILDDNIVCLFDDDKLDSHSLIINNFLIPQLHVTTQKFIEEFFHLKTMFTHSSYHDSSQ